MRRWNPNLITHTVCDTVVTLTQEAANKSAARYVVRPVLPPGHQVLPTKTNLTRSKNRPSLKYGDELWLTITRNTQNYLDVYLPCQRALSLCKTVRDGVIPFRSSFLMIVKLRFSSNNSKWSLWVFNKINHSLMWNSCSHTTQSLYKETVQVQTITHIFPRIPTMGILWLSG